MAGETGGIAVLAEVIVKLIANILDHLLGPRADIVYFETPRGWGLLGAQQVNTHSIVVQNLGRKVVENLRVIHNWRPADCQYQITPDDRGPQIIPMPGGQLAFSIDYIRPSETIFITYIYGTPPPQPLLRSMGTSGRDSRSIEFPKAAHNYPLWVTVLSGVLMLLGSGFALYYVIKGLHLLHSLLS